MAALSKNTTYQQMMDLIRMKLGIYDNPIFSDALLIQKIDHAVSNFYAKQAGRDFYQQRATYSLSGSSNPYHVDLSSTIPFPYNIIDVVYKGSGRTSIKQVSQIKLEEELRLGNINANSIFCSIGGDSIDVGFGSDITVVTSDSIEVLYQRQPTQYKNFLVDRGNSLANGLIAYYKSEDGTDSWNDYDGTASGITFTTGKVNNGINFGSASTSCLNLGTNTIFDFERTNPFSILFWMKLDSFSTDREFIGRHLAPPTLKGWRIRQAASNNRLLTELYNTSSGGKFIQVQTAAFTSTSWTHVAMTYAGTSLASGITFRLNAVSQSLSVGTNNLTDSMSNGTNASAIIGNESGTLNKNLKGMMDEIAIYNRVVSQMEVEDHYNGGDGQTLISNMRKTTGIDVLDSDIPFIQEAVTQNLRGN